MFSAAILLCFQTEKIKARLLNKSDYLPYIRNRNSLAFNKKRFDDMYLQRDTSLPFERKFGAMNGIEVNLDSPENPDYPREERKQQCIKAWNSSSRMKCIQLVAYKFRHQQVIFVSSRVLIRKFKSKINCWLTREQPVSLCFPFLTTI